MGVVIGDSGMVKIGLNHWGEQVLPIRAPDRGKPGVCGRVAQWRFPVNNKGLMVVDVLIFLVII